MLITRLMVSIRDIECSFQVVGVGLPCECASILPEIELDKHQHLIVIHVGTRG